MIEPHLAAHEDDSDQFAIEPERRGTASRRVRKIYHLTSRRGIYLLTDECYCHFLYDGKPFSIASMPGAKETVLVAGTLSKPTR
jgi:aspartate aminotransferase